MRITGHQHVAVAFAQLLQSVEERAHAVRRLPQFVAQEEFQIDQHLIVARAAGVDLLAHLAQTPREQQFDLRVDVLRPLLDLEPPLLDLASDLFQPRQQGLQLVGRQQADVFQHPDVGHRPFDVVPGQPHVELTVVAHRETFDHLVGFETLVP